MDLQILIKTVAQQHGLEPELVGAFCFVESNTNPLAVRFEPAYKYFVTPKTWAKRMNISEATETNLQQCSWGMMQVMGGVARELGLKDSILMLIDAETGLQYGCKKLKQCIDKHPLNLIYAIASYNAGSPRFDTKGILVNREYVDKVLSKYNELKKKG